MSYTPIDTSLPGGDTLAGAIEKINSGFSDTLREIAMGAAPGWSWALIGSDPNAPTAEQWSRGAERLRIEYAYSGGRITVALYRVSLDGGVTWSNKGTLTYVYDANGYLTGSAWS